MHKIDKLLQESQKTGTDHIKSITEPMQAKFDKYWKKMDNMAAVSLVFDPQSKLDLLEFLSSDGNHCDSVEEQIESIKTTLYNWFGEISQHNNLQTHGATSLDNKNPKAKTKAKENDEDRFKKYLAGKKTSKNSSATGELDLYLQEPTVDIDSPSFNLLEWWKFNALRFPTLLIMAKRLLMAPMTSIALESAFSTGGRVLNDFRSTLNADTLEALICAQDWIRAEEGISDFTLNPEGEGKQ